MATTSTVHIDSAVPELWARLTLRDMLRGGFWANFVGGEGSGSPVIRVTDLVGNPGDTIHIQVTAPLAGSGVAGDETTLEGSEENLSTTSIKTIPLLYRHGVRSFRRAQKKSIVDLREEAKLRLAEWGQEKMDDVRFTNYVLSGAINGETYTPNTFTEDVGNGGVPGDVDAGDDLDVVLIQRGKVQMYVNRAKPLKSMDGSDLFGLVGHQNSIYKLKRDQEYRDWVKDAEVRGKDNPFFRGALAMVDGVVLFQHSNVPTANDGSASLAVSRNIMFGAEAFIEGLDEGVTWVEDTFDYENQFGIAYSFAFQPRRALAKNSLILYADATTV